MALQSIIPQRVLHDIRDQNTYTVRKLADGNVWMTENLRLQNKAISSSDSNLPAGKIVLVPPSSSDPWCKAGNDTCINKLMTLDSGNNAYGIYYNWYTATGTYGIRTSRGEVEYSICARGWHLPTSSRSLSDNSEFGVLSSHYNTAILLQSSFGPGLVRSGLSDGGTAGSQGVYGLYWSATANNANGVINIRISENNFNINENNFGYWGFSVRCISK